MAGGDDFILAIPDETVEREQTSRDVQHRSGRLLWCTRVHNRDTAVMSGKGKGITAGRETDTLDPAS